MYAIIANCEHIISRPDLSKEMWSVHEAVNKSSSDPSKIRAALDAAAYKIKDIKEWDALVVTNKRHRRERNTRKHGGMLNAISDTDIAEVSATSTAHRNKKAQPRRHYRPTPQNNRVSGAVAAASVASVAERVPAPEPTTSTEPEPGPEPDTSLDTDLEAVARGEHWKMAVESLAMAVSLKPSELR
jgi:hypothetical protein